MAWWGLTEEQPSCTEHYPDADLSAGRGSAHRAVKGASPAAAQVDPAPAQGWDLSQAEGAGPVGRPTRTRAGARA